MKKYRVRYSIPELIVDYEDFTTKEEALKYYDYIIDTFGYWTERDIYEINN